MHPRYRRPGQEALEGVTPKCDYDRGFDGLQLRGQVLGASLNFSRQRIPVAGRTTLEDVGDEDIIASQAGGGEKLIEQLAGLSHKRTPLLVLVEAGGLADEDYGRIRVALAGNRVCSLRSQRACAAGTNSLSDGCQLGRGVDHRPAAAAALVIEESWRRPRGAESLLPTGFSPELC
jgi:hypothetical protein